MGDEEKVRRRRVMVLDDNEEVTLTTNQIKRLKEAQALQDNQPESKIVSILTNIFWIGVGIAVLLYFDVINAVKYDTRIDWFSFQLACALLGFASLVLVVAVFIIQKLLGRNYDVELPWAVPTATISGLLSIVGFIFAFYPAYGIVTVPLVVVSSISFIITLATVTSFFNI
eukprot:m.7955 g.7955  ORF g.7955 m.7955 type:complete len:171 (+) comp2969_c0_seq1:72-584(+)